MNGNYFLLPNKIFDEGLTPMEFMETKKQFNKTDGVQFYYAVQSFEEDTDISPILAHQIAIEWVEECYPGYQALVCTHMDTDNIHSHIIINSVNSLDGHKIHQNKNDIERVRYVNDQLCMQAALFAFSIQISVFPLFRKVSPLAPPS